MGAVVLVMRVSGSADTRSKADGYLVSGTGLTGLSVTRSQADGWIGLPFLAGSLPDEITAIVWVSDAICAELGVNLLSASVVADSLIASVEVDTSSATIKTNEISAGVT